MALEIDAAEVEQLESSLFMDFLNHLINAECNKLGIPPTRVKTSSELTSAEGGVDGRIEDDEQRADGRWIPHGLTVWQFKTGETNTRPSKLEKEAVKPGVLKALEEGGSYLVAIARRCDTSMRERRERSLRKAVAKKRLDPNRVTLLTADDLKKWASEHASIVLLPYFRRPVGMCMRLEQWERNPLHQGEFVADEARRRIIDSVRSFLSQKTSPVHKRLLGRKGVGKTRLAMEALSALGIRERAVYAQEPNHVPPEFWAWMRSSTVTSVTLAVDECDEHEASKLMEQAEICGGRVRLITIGTGEPFLSETSPNYLYVERLDSESMTKMIRDRFKGLSYEQTAWIERLTAGYPKLAVACGKVVEGRGEIDIAKLTQTAEIKEILKIFLPDEKDRRVMQALSLLTRVGFEEDIAKEAQTLADFVQVRWSEFCDVVERMHREGLVGKKGRYRYVTPDLLASWLAASLWNVRTDEVRELLGRLPTEECRDAFLERLKDLGTDERAQAVIRELLSERSFSTIEQLDSEGTSKILYTLALADRQSALGTLQRLLSNASIDRLRSFKNGRRNVVYALQYLKWFKDAFFEATRLLLALAEAENEEWANNSTGIWTSCFQLRLGGTEVPVLDRVSILKEAFATDSPKRRQLALKAIAVLMSPHESRVSGLEKEGAQPVPPEWHPKTWVEIWEVYRVALQLVDQAIQDSDPNVAQEARATLLRSARTVVIVGLADEIIARLEAFTPHDDVERREVRNTVRIILQYESEKLKDGQRNRLTAIEQKLAGTSFSDRLRRWVGQWSFGDWDIQQREGGPSPQNRAAALAEEAMNRPELLHVQLDWLVSTEAQNVAYFGKRLGELDQDLFWLSELVPKTRGEGRPHLLASYLWGRSRSGDEERICNLLDRWVKEDKQLAPAVLLTTLELEPSAENLNRLLGLVKKGWLQPKELNVLVWKGWSEKLPIVEFEAFLNCLLLDDEPETIHAAMNLLDRRLKLSPGESERLAPFGWRMLERESALEGTMAQHYWGELSSHYVKIDPVKTAETILKIIEKGKIFLQDDPPMKALAEATRSRPKEVWDRAAKVLLQKGEHAYRLQLHLKCWYVELVPVDQLLAWASRCAPKGPRVLAALTLPSGRPMATLPRELLVRFGDDEYVGEGLHANFVSGSFTGTMTDWLRNKLETARTWTSDLHPRVCDWAQKVVKNLEERIQKWAKYEQEEQIT